jgi:hypothetical protein
MTEIVFEVLSKNFQRKTPFIKMSADDGNQTFTSQAKQKVYQRDKESSQMESVSAVFFKKRADRDQISANLLKN